MKGGANKSSKKASKKTSKKNNAVIPRLDRGIQKTLYLTNSILRLKSNHKSGRSLMAKLQPSKLVM